MVIQFQGDSDLVKKLLKSSLKVIQYCEKYAEELAKSGELTGVIQSKLVNIATKAVNFGEPGDKKFSEQQLYWLEIHLKIDDLWQLANEKFNVNISKALEESEEISKLKKYKQLLREGDKFDFQLYLHHLKNCTDEQKDAIKVNLESNKPIFDVMTRCHIDIPDVQRMTINMKDSTKLKPLSYYGISNAPDKDIQLKVAKDKEIKWSSGSLYFFYPVRKQSIVGFGYSENGPMGKCIDGNHNNPNISALHEEVPQDFKPVKVWGSYNYNLILGENGQLVESGNGNSNVCSNTEFKLVKGLKGEIDQISVSHDAVWVLLKDNTLWYKGETRSYSMPENSNKTAFTQHKIWTEKGKEETIVDIVSSHGANFFVTDKGKLWARGESFLSFIDQSS